MTASPGGHGDQERGEQGCGPAVVGGVLGAGQLAVADELFAADYVRHDPDGPMIGRDAIRGFVAGIRADLPNLSFTTDDVVAAGDRVMVRWTAMSTHAPTQRRLTFGGMDILRVRDGTIVESWPCFDQSTIARQIGGPAPADRSAP